MAKVKLGKFEIEEAELDRQYEEATRRGEEEFIRAPKAVSAKFDPKTKRLIVEMRYGVTFIIPTELVQGLRGASDKDLAEVELWLEGVYLHWEKLDTDFKVSSLMKGIFGTPKWMAELNSNLDTESKPRKKVA
ncbi:MAG: DUF2442 domain-containing protein [Pyrinomonadaceae bacterium]